MASKELLDQLAQLGIYGKKYKDFESAPPEAQGVIRFVAKSNPALPPPDSNRPQPRAPSDARLRKIEAALARIEKGLAQQADAIARIEALDVVASAASIRADRVAKIKAGIARAKRLGKAVGRPVVGFHLEEALALQAQGVSLRKIAANMGMPLSTVASKLRQCTPGRVN